MSTRTEMSNFTANSFMQHQHIYNFADLHRHYTLFISCLRIIQYQLFIELYQQ